MSGLLALVKLDAMFEKDFMMILIVVDPEVVLDVREEILQNFHAFPSGPAMRNHASDLLVKRPSRNGVTSFVTVGFQSWKVTPRWSVYWDGILLITTATTLDKDRQKWTEYLADYVRPGGEMCQVWRE